MFARFALGTLLLVGTLGSAATAPKVYAVSWSQVEGSSERRALTEQIDRQLRDELRRRGATVVDVNAAGSAILLKPRLEIFPRALELNVVGVRGADRKLLGTISMRAAGSSRQAQLKALVTRACAEADQLE